MTQWITQMVFKHEPTSRNLKGCNHSKRFAVIGTCDDGDVDFRGKTNQCDFDEWKWNKELQSTVWNLIARLRTLKLVTSNDVISYKVNTREKNQGHVYRDVEFNRRDNFFFSLVCRIRRTKRVKVWNGELFTLDSFILFAGNPAFHFLFVASPVCAIKHESSEKQLQDTLTRLKKPKIYDDNFQLVVLISGKIKIRIKKFISSFVSSSVSAHFERHQIKARPKIFGVEKWFEVKQKMWLEAADKWMDGYMLGNQPMPYINMAIAT